MTKAKTARPSFTMRLQPYEGSLLAEVVQHLNSIDRAEAQRRVESVLVMALLAQARLYDPSCSPEEKRRCCIESCDALDKHASTLRQLVGVEALPARHAVVQPDEASARVTRETDSIRPVPSQKTGDEDTENEPPMPSPKARLEAKASATDVDALFGG